MIYQTLKEIKFNKKIIIYHHLGLGDVIICNGLINFISDKFEKVYLVANKAFQDQVKFLYSTNNKVEIIVDLPKKVNDVDEFVNNYSLENSLDILKIGFSKSKLPFYKNYYKQLGVPYSYSYKYFNCTRDFEKENIIYQFFLEHFEIENENYILVHNEASTNTFNLDIKNKNNIVYLKKDLDFYSNIFYFTKLIENAKEIHCINSSYLHLVDRLTPYGKLFYHDIRGSRIKLNKKWKIIKYDN